MRHYITFLFLLFCFSATAQWRMVGTSGGWTNNGGGSYSATITFQSDLTGNGYLATQIEPDSFKLFTPTEQTYTLTASINETFNTADITISQTGTTTTAPVGQVMVYDPSGKTAIPQVPFGSTGASAQLQAAVDSYNARVIGTGGSGGVSDGNKVDITVSGDTWTLNADVVGSSEIAADAVGASEMVAADVESEYNTIISVVSQAEAEAGTATTTRRWTAERVKQAIVALAPAASVSETVSNDSLFLTIDGTKRYVGQRAAVTTLEQFGAIRDDGIDDSAALLAAFNATTTGGTILFRPGVYDIYNRTIINRGVNLVGYGATLKRCNEISSTLTEDAPNTQDFVLVAEPDTFAVGDQVLVLNSAGGLGGVGHNDHSATFIIENISGDTLFLDNVLSTSVSSNLIPATYVTGCKVVKIFSILFLSDTQRYRIEGITFDGNRDNNTSSLSWKAYRTIDRIGGSSVIKNCRFLNIPTENIYANNDLTVTGNYARNGNGSFIHFTGNNDERGRRICTDNIIIDFNLVSTDTMGHNEAIFVASAKTDSIIIADNIAVNLDKKGNGFFGSTNSYDVKHIITGNMVANMETAVTMNTIGNDPDPPVVDLAPVIANNIFYDCGLISSQTTATGGGTNLSTDGEGYIGLRITGNTLINTYIDVTNQVDAIISDNYIRFDSSYVRVDEFPTLEESAIDISGVGIKITDNIIYNDKWSGASFPVGIFYGASLSPGLISGTRYAISGNYEIAGNIIQGFNRALDINANAAAPQDEARVIRIHNNMLMQRDSSSASSQWLVGVYPGVIFYDNTLYCYSGASQGIRIRGVTSSQNTAINGPIVYNNTILGASEAMEIGRTSNDGYNSTVINNFYTGTIDWNDPGSQGNVVSGNILLPAATVPPLDWLRIRRNMN